MSTEQRGRDTTETIDTMPEAESTASYSSNVPELSRGERREVARRTRLSAIVVHETVREEGERELQRHPGDDGLVCSCSRTFHGLFPCRPGIASYLLTGRILESNN